MLIFDLSKPVNKLTLTLREQQTVCTNIYLIQLINASSNEEFFVVAADKSCSPDRYQDFCITTISGSTVANPYNSELNLPLKGQYYYNAYANPDSLIDPTGLNQVETGKLLCIGPEITPIAYQSNVNPGLKFYQNKDLND